jgi:1-acyl-sn-glycerol-3-phosphate acyltransferase
MARLARSLTTDLPWSGIRAFCRLAMRRADVRVEGLGHLPATGPAVIAARHFHHFYDGCALLAVVPRPLHVVVALDWVQNPAGRQVMERACQAAGWPAVDRPEAFNRPGEPADGARGTTDPARLRAATRESVRLLRAGKLLLVFPEGFPNVDPGYTPKTTDDAFLPFRRGFLRFVAYAERDGRTRVPIVPVGLEYRRGARWHLTMRFAVGVRSGAGSGGASPRHRGPGAHPVWPRHVAISRKAAGSDWPGRVHAWLAVSAACRKEPRAHLGCAAHPPLSPAPAWRASRSACLWTILTEDRQGYAHHPETKRWRGKLAALFRRHEALTAEMERRGYRHRSPLDSRLATGMAAQHDYVDAPEAQLALLRHKGCGCAVADAGAAPA